MRRGGGDRSLGFREGVRAAAAFIGQWDKRIDHPYRIEDVVLCKFNLTRRQKPRRKVSA